jgi:hypothetical protein
MRTKARHCFPPIKNVGFDLKCCSPFNAGRHGPLRRRANQRGDPGHSAVFLCASRKANFCLWQPGSRGWLIVHRLA